MLRGLTCSAKFVSVQPETRERYRTNVIKSVGRKYTCFSCSIFEEHSEFGQGRTVVSVKFHMVNCTNTHQFSEITVTPCNLPTIPTVICPLVRTVDGKMLT